jgi:diaminopimelate epimerase
VKFWKYEGTANDFIVLESPHDLRPEVVSKWCDRHRGIGADGVICLHRLDAHRASMIIRNADGSRPEMCGNGVRCAAMHLAAGTTLAEVDILADAGPRKCAIAPAKDGVQVRVDMGEITVAGAMTVSDSRENLLVFPANAGNPHAVTFARRSDEELVAWGRYLQTASEFPAGVNFERAIITGAHEITVDVFERGVGITLACGTGACAVAVVAQSLGKVSAGKTLVQLPGGVLTIEAIAIADRRYRVQMSGAARCVFSGEVTADDSVFFDSKSSANESIDGAR